MAGQIKTLESFDKILILIVKILFDGEIIYYNLIHYYFKMLIYNKKKIYHTLMSRRIVKQTNTFFSEEEY